MNETTRRFLLTCGVFVLVACVCVSLLAIGGGALALFTADRAPVMSAVAATATGVFPTATEPSGVTATAMPTSEPAGTAAPTEVPALSPDVLAQMDRIEQQVEELRGLSALQPVTRTILTREELQQRVHEDFLQDYTPEESRQDTLVLAAFGLLDPEFDLLALYGELYTEQIAGFYDDEEKTMYVVQDADFTGVERLTYAHEYVHALQDQHYDFQNGLGMNDEQCDADSERCAAIQALVEGDASFTETNWLYRYATPQDLRDLQRFYQDYSSPVYDAAPAFLQADFLFPYQEGQNFVEYLYNQGGMEAIDQAYTDPPRSTEQILHPERYPDDVPQQVPLPDLLPVLGDGWEVIDQDVLGEWYTFLMLAYANDPRVRQPETPARQAAEGWGGDAYAVYHHAETDQTALVLDTRWDTHDDAAEFAEMFRAYADARWGAGSGDRWEADGASVRFFVQEARTLWVLAPTPEVAQALMNALR